MLVSAIILAIVSFILVKVGGEDIKTSLTILGIATFLVPMLSIAISSTSAMIGAGAEASRAIANEATNSLVNVFTAKLPDYFMSEIAGICVGAFTAIITGK
ncbi:MAG: hypothetical protein RBT40_09290 [Petrimonas sp.]|jgi:hypothetical protein|nr:hypothetical protein [Petrimonas sp.]